MKKFFEIPTPTSPREQYPTLKKLFINYLYKNAIYILRKVQGHTITSKFVIHKIKNSITNKEKIIYLYKDKKRKKNMRPHVTLISAH